MSIDGERLAAVKTLERLGYTYGGGELWKPPLGPSAAPLLDRIAELGDVLVLVESFLDGWHMPDEECQAEANSLLAVVKEAMQKIEQ